MDIPQADKQCRTCSTTKPLSEFYRRGGGRGYRSHCKLCHTTETLRNRKPAAHAASNKRWREGKYANVRLSERRRTLTNYGLTPDSWEALVAHQGDTCAACGEPATEEWWTIDHDHRCCNGPFSCGACVRGLVHRSCNSAMGYVGDDPEKLRLLADYLAGQSLRTLQNIS